MDNKFLEKGYWEKEFELDLEGEGTIALSGEKTDIDSSTVERTSILDELNSNIENLIALSGEKTDIDSSTVERTSILDELNSVNESTLI